MYAEVAKLTAYLSFEYIYQHDVYHCLNQCVRSFAPPMRQLVHPSRIVVVLHDAELQQEKQNYEELCRGLQAKETVSDIRTYYRDFLGWANEFDCASLPRKRAILSQLLDSVEVGRGYKIIIHMNVNYEQFLHPDTQEEFCTADICAGG